MATGSRSGGAEALKKIANDSVLAEVPKQIFEQTLAKLADQKLPDEIVARLRKALIEDATFNEAAIRTALFGTEGPA
jgi:hypothetical protein